MKRSSLMIAPLLCLITVCGSFGQDKPRYRAVFGESEVFFGKVITGWDTATNPAKLDARLLFDKSTGVIRYLEKLDAKVKLTGPFIEFLNGDVLPGLVVGHEDENTLAGMPAYYMVHLRGPLAPYSSTDETIRIKANRVKRLVFSSASNQMTTTASRQPGTVILANGQVLKTAELRWSATGLRGLSETSSFNASWEELSAVDPPVDNTFSDIDAVLDDLLAPAVDPEARIGRLVTTHGAILTYREDMLVPQRRESNTLYHAVQPAWSLDSISVRFDEIMLFGYRAHNEIPLSAFPATLLEQRSFTGFNQPWKRNQNTRGGILASGTMFADVGIGTHSYSKIAFAIPTGFVTRFRGHVGIDRITQGGGCARVKIIRGIAGGDDVDAYQSGHLIGTNGSTSFNLSDFTKCDRIVLETNFGDQGRPGGADPFDIRDDVSWMLALLTINVPEIQSRAWWGLQQYYPQLSNWTIPDNFKTHIRISAYWNPAEGRWMHALSWKAPVATVIDTPILEFSQKVVLTLKNSWFTVSGASDGIGDKTATIRVTVNGEPIPSARDRDVELKGQIGAFDMNHWALGARLGEEVEIKVQVMPREAGTYKPQGLTIGLFGLQPLIVGLPAAADTLPVPDVPLTSLKPIAFTLPGYTEMPPVGILEGEQLLQVGSLPIADGFVFPGKGEITYKLKPQYAQLEMIIGLAAGDGDFGPYEVLVDDELIWTSRELFTGEEVDGRFNKTIQGAHVKVAIPQGRTAITIRSGDQTGGIGLLGNAGFIIK